MVFPGLVERYGPDFHFKALFRPIKGKVVQLTTFDFQGPQIAFLKKITPLGCKK